MAHHAQTLPAIKSHDAEKSKKKIMEFWKNKEKSTPDVFTHSPPPSPSPSPTPGQSKPISITHAGPSTTTTSPSPPHDVNSINASAQLRITNSVNISASLSVNTSTNHTYSSTPISPSNYLHRGRTHSEATPPHITPVPLKDRIRSSQEGEIIITHAPNGTDLHTRKLNNSGNTPAEGSHNHVSSTTNHFPTTLPNNPSLSNSGNIKTSPPTAIRSTSLHTVQEPTAAQLSHRRRSLNERIPPLEFTLQERPAKPPPKTAAADEMNLLWDKIQESEILLNALETQLKKETLKRIDNKYSKELEVMLQKGDTKQEADQQLLQELENYKKLQIRYQQVLDEVSSYKEALAKLSEQINSNGTDMPLDFNPNKRRLSIKNSSNPSIPPPGVELPTKPRKTNSFNEAITNLRRVDISRTSIKILGPLASSKRQSHKNIEIKQEPPEIILPQESSHSEGEVESSDTTTMHAELFKQLIQQKYACPENIRSPFINNLRATWRQRVSKSDSWASRLQAGDWESQDEDDDEDDETEVAVLRGSGITPSAKKVGSKSQNYIGIPDYSEDSRSARERREAGEIMLTSRYINTGNKTTSSDSATNSYLADDSDDESTTTETRKKQAKYADKIKNIFSKDKPAHLDQSDVGRLAETLKRRPTYQQLVSKKIIRGDGVFGVPLANLIDIPDGVRMMADFLADSGNLDLLDVPGIERDVINVQNAVDAGTHSVEMMQILPYAVGTLFMRFLEQLPEKLFVQQLAPKFLWVQEAEIATLRYTMFRSLIFLLVVPHRNMAAFLFKWLRKMSEDPRKSMYYTSAYLGNIFGNLILYGDTARAANTTQKLIEDYKHVFLDAEPDIRHVMKDGKQLVKWATVDRLIEKIVDPNCYDEQLPSMFFFVHSYFIAAKDLLEKMIGIYLKCKIGPPATWKSEVCKRISTMLKLWVENHGLSLSTNDAYVSLMSDFMKRRRDCGDSDAVDKELDRVLYHHRTMKDQSLLRNLAPTTTTARQMQFPALAGSGGKAKQLSIPAPILEHAPDQPDDSALLPASAPTSPRTADPIPTRAYSQAHFKSTPPTPLSMTYLNGSKESIPKGVKAGSNSSGKTPSTPIPVSQPSSMPSLTRNHHNRYTRGPIPPFSPGTSPPFRSGSPARPRAVSNVGVLTHSSSSPSSSPLTSPRNSPPASAINPSVFAHTSSSPPAPTSKYSTTTLSSQTTRDRSFSKATVPDIIIPEDKKTFRYTKTYGTLKGNLAVNTQSLPLNYTIPFSPTSSAAPTFPHFPSPTSQSSPGSPVFPISPTSPTSPTSPLFPMSPTLPSILASPPETVRFSELSSISDTDIHASNSSENAFQIPKSFSVDSHLASAEGPTKRNRAYSVVQHGRSASAQLPTSGPSAATELIEIDPKIIAEHMTILDHESLKAIPMSELLQKNYTDPKKSPNFASMVQKLNEWGSWTLKEILKHQELYDRVNALSLFIEIAKENLAYSNFNSCYGIIGALNNPAILRLRNTWEKVNKKTKSNYRKIMELFDFAYNSKNYREALKIAKPPAVPYLGLIPKDITSVEEIPTFVENGMCNLDKMRTLYKILSEVQSFQKEQYKFTIFPDFITRLKTKELYTDEEAYQRSLKLEPREIMTA